MGDGEQKKEKGRSQIRRRAGTVTRLGRRVVLGSRYHYFMIDTY